MMGSVDDDDDFIPQNTPPLTQHTAAKRPAAPTHECTGPAGTGPRRIATEEKGRVSGTATPGQPKLIWVSRRMPADIPKYALRPHSFERLAHPVQHIAGARRAPALLYVVCPVPRFIAS